MVAGWRQVVIDQLDVRGAEVRKRSSGASQSTSVSRVGFSPKVQPLLVQAARARGISIAGYIRRATMAFVAKDLGLDPIQLFEQDMAPSPYGRGGTKSDRDLDGKRYGHWKVHPDESHTQP